MRHKRLIVLIFIMIFVSIGTFLIYKNEYKYELNYVVIGDSLASGRNPYGVDDYGYTDYIRDYLKQNQKLKSYVSYAVSGHEISDVIEDIDYNKIEVANNKKIGIKKALRESDLVTISIGANDFLNNINLHKVSQNLSDDGIIHATLEELLSNINSLLKLIKQYAKGDIIVVGYYNPMPNLDRYENRINEIIKIADDRYKKICDDNGVYYVKISGIIARNSEYLPNPLDIHPNKSGYEAISKEVIKTIEQKVLK